MNVITDRDPGDETAYIRITSPTPTTDKKPCSFCGSTACEWDGPLLLGCEDCGYEVGDPVDDPIPYSIAARSLFGPPEPMSVDEMESLHRLASLGNPDLHRDIRRGK